MGFVVVRVASPLESRHLEEDLYRSTLTGNLTPIALANRRQMPLTASFALFIGNFQDLLLLALAGRETISRPGKFSIWSIGDRLKKLRAIAPETSRANNLMIKSLARPSARAEVPTGEDLQVIFLTGKYAR